MPPQERQAYDRHLENIMIQNDVLSAAKEEGIEQVIEQGSLKATKAIAFNMKAKLGSANNQPIYRTFSRRYSHTITQIREIHKYLLPSPLPEPESDKIFPSCNR